MAKKLKIQEEHRLDDLTSVAKTIMPLAKQLLGTKGFLEMDLLAGWKNIVGEDLAQYTLPQKISFRKDQKIDGTLELMVLSGAFAMEVQQREKQIIEKINTFFGYGAISKLKLIQNSCPDNFLIKQNTIDNMKKNVVSKAEESYITELVKDVNNDDLRKQLENLGKAVFSNQKR
jgi:hypothetical protein